MAATADRPRVINIATSHFGAAAISISVQDTGPGIEPQLAQSRRYWTVKVTAGGGSRAFLGPNPLLSRCVSHDCDASKGATKADVAGVAYEVAKN
jgi:hypothetical protein